jgi:type IV pilus assembly protein PilB
VTAAALALDIEELRSLFVGDLELLTLPDFDQCVSLAERRHVPLLRALAERARVPYAQLLSHLAQQWNVEFIGLRPADVDLQVLPLLSEEAARRLGAVAFGCMGSTLNVAMADPRDAAALAELRRLLRASLVVWLADPAAIARTWLLYRPALRDLVQRAGQGRLPASIGETKDAPSPADLLTRLFEYAAAACVSDIHIEPFEHETIVRFRVDGVLHETLVIASSLALPLVARVKVLAQMRVDEKRVPQDGRLRVDLSGYPLEMRASSLPTMWGEKIVLRVLSQDGVVLDLADLGLAEADLDVVVKHVLQPFGMVLVTGPTGSGKTTSHYSFLLRVSAERQGVVNISTVEDPIEYTMARINQVPIRPDAGLDFAAGLRALLRQDPDVVMVGEIRDRETADMAVRAALVGRLMLSSLHTNDAPSAVPRLLDMGIEPYLLASTLSLVIGQRLVRRLCDQCRETHTTDSDLMASLAAREDWPGVMVGLRARGILSATSTGLSGLQVFRGRGCAKCHGTGYRGRLALFEVLAFDESLRRLVASRSDASAIRAAAIRHGYRPMIVDGLAKAVLGLTTLDEVMRAAA